MQCRGLPPPGTPRQRRLLRPCRGGTIESSRIPRVALRPRGAGCASPVATGRRPVGARSGGCVGRAGIVLSGVGGAGGRDFPFLWHRPRRRAANRPPRPTSAAAEGEWEGEGMPRRPASGSGTHTRRRCRRVCGGGRRLHQHERSRAAARCAATLEAECGLRRPARWRALHAGERGTERSHQVLAEGRLAEATPGRGVRFDHRAWPLVLQGSVNRGG